MRPSSPTSARMGRSGRRRRAERDRAPATPEPAAARRRSARASAPPRRDRRLRPLHRPGTQRIPAWIKAPTEPRPDRRRRRRRPHPRAGGHRPHRRAPSPAPRAGLPRAAPLPRPPASPPGGAKVARRPNERIITGGSTWADEPVLARLLMVEVFAAGAAARGRYEETARELAARFDQGRPDSGGEPLVGAAATRAVFGGGELLVREE